MKNILALSSTLALALAFAVACGGDADPAKDAATGAEVADVITDPDVTIDPDVVSTDTVPDVPVGPQPFRVGAASILLPAPLGIPICGNFPSGGAKTPYCANFPGTTTVYMHPTLRAIALEAEGERLLLVRADLIGMRPLLVHALEQRLTAETGDDWTGHVLVGASHTHSSAGRIMPGMIWEILADEFFPALFWQLIDGFAQVCLAAIEDMEPGAFGWDTALTDALHNDRRCENPPLQDDRVWVLRFDGEDGDPKALLMVHSIHGTVIGADALHFSRDMLGGVEEKVREAFDHPVTVMLWQAGTGDMAPNDAPEPVDNDPIPKDYGRIEGVGEVARDLVGGLVPDIETSSEITLASLSAYAPLDRQALGYEDGEFPYEGGGAYCDMEGAECYDEAVGWAPLEDLDEACLDVELFLGEGMPRKTFFSSARIGDLLLVTYPGEPVTACTLEVEENIKHEFPDQEILVVGYSQDYIGYSTPEHDWYQGGYEASGAIWGPKQGDYVTARVSELGLHMLDPDYPLPFDQPVPFEVPENDASPWNVSVSVTAGTVVTEPVDAAASEIVVFEFTGGDPWLLLPRILLEREVDGAWEPVTWPSGEPLDGTGYEYIITMNPDPDYATNISSTVRTFTWRVDLPTRRHQTPGFGDLEGTYRFSVTGDHRDAESLEIESYSVTSGPFDITP